MKKPPRISLDAMGGDYAPEIVVQGADRASAAYPDISLIFVGDERKIGPLLKKTHYVQKACIHHTDEAVAPEAKPSQALRAGKNTSMWKAIELVANGEVDAVVSAGNTGALMAMSKLQMKMIEGVTRPAIAGFFPNPHGQSCVLDLGANIECDAENLIQFAIMGSAFYRDIHGGVSPSVGLLNVGEEDQKGFDYLREAAAVLGADSLNLNYHGFVEGSDIAGGKVDVVVTDGFSGNVALKTAEGTANFITSELKNVMTGTLIGKISSFLNISNLKKFKKRLDPRLYNGAIFIGLDSPVVKSHGGTDFIGFSNSLDVCNRIVKGNLINKIKQNI